MSGSRIAEVAEQRRKRDPILKERLFGRYDAKTLLETERGRVVARIVMAQVGGEMPGEK